MLILQDFNVSVIAACDHRRKPWVLCSFYFHLRQCAVVYK